MPTPAELVRFLAGSESGVAAFFSRFHPTWEQASILRNTSVEDMARALDRPDANHRASELFFVMAQVLCGHQEDGNRPPLDALRSLAKRAGLGTGTDTPADLAAAWEEAWAADPDAKPVQNPKQRILHQGLTHEAIVAPDRNGWTLVHEIASRGCFRRFVGLLNPEDLTIRDQAFFTPLHEYARRFSSVVGIPLSFWQPDWLAMGFTWTDRTTFWDRLKEDHEYVRENFAAFHPEVQALFLADLFAR
jgi:hypothetical protein